MKDRGERLTHDTRRRKSFLTAKAVAADVDRELEIIGGIQCALADVEAGRVVTQDGAMVDIGAVIDAARYGKT